MIRLTYSNLDEVQPGYTVFYRGVPGYAELRGESVVVNGMTLKELLDSHDQVYFVK